MSNLFCTCSEVKHNSPNLPFAEVFAADYPLREDYRHFEAHFSALSPPPEEQLCYSRSSFTVFGVELVNELQDIHNKVNKPLWILFATETNLM